MGLRQRIVFPFVGLFTVVYAVGVAATVGIVSRSVEESLQDRARSLEDLVREVPGATNHPGYAQYLKTVYRADVAVFRDEALSSFCSLPPEAARDLARREFWPPEGAFVPWRDYLAVRRGDSFLFFPAGVLEDEKRAVVRPLLGIAAVGLAVVALCAILIGQSVARPIEALAARARGLTGRPGEALEHPGGGREITDLVAALNRMRETLRRSERLAVLGQVSAGVAHEIRNPLSAMKLTVQMLREERPPAEREPYDLLLREIERLELAASEFSAAARPVPIEGTAPTRPAVELDRAVDEVVELLGPQLEHLKVRIERRFSPVPPVPADVRGFKRAAMNLILNGAEAMPRGGALTVSLEPRESFVRFSVTDTGPGVPADLRERIFDPFVTGKLDGVGLGLALTRRIVEDHGGRIGFDTSAYGSTFWIDLPVARDGREAVRS